MAVESFRNFRSQWGYPTPHLTHLFRQNAEQFIGFAETQPNRVEPPYLSPKKQQHENYAANQNWSAKVYAKPPPRYTHSPPLS